MHDPLTLICKLPFGMKLWHRDPEMDDTDDSCGWVFPRISGETIEKLYRFAAREYRFIVKPHGYYHTPFELTYECWQLCSAFYSGNKGYLYRSVSHRELVNILSLSTNCIDNIREISVYAQHSIDEFKQFMLIVYRNYLRFRRPWWRHPRLHVRHWYISFPKRQKHFVGKPHE